MKKWLCALTLVLASAASLLLLSRPASQPVAEADPVRTSPKSFPVLFANERLTDFTAAYVSPEGEETAPDIQCPIPMKDRVFNQTRIQCVYASAEMLGRWAEEPKLINPPLTSRADCKGYSSPSRLAQILNSINVKFEQSYNNRPQGRALIHRAMAEGRGCMWGVPGHAMVIVHFDEYKNVMKWVDNSDRSLKVQTTTIAGFEKRWDSWICVIYADNDIVPMKMKKVAPSPSPTPAYVIPIKDRNNPQGTYPKDYIPTPKN